MAHKTCIGLFLLLLTSCAATDKDSREMNAAEYKIFNTPDYLYPDRNTPPAYPLQAFKKQVSGEVILRFDILGSGKVDNVKVIKSEPEGVFDKAAMRSLRKWQYKQIIKDGYQLSRPNQQFRFIFSAPHCIPREDITDTDIEFATVCVTEYHQ